MDMGNTLVAIIIHLQYRLGSQVYSFHLFSRRDTSRIQILTLVSIAQIIATSKDNCLEVLKLMQI